MHDVYFTFLGRGAPTQPTSVQTVNITSSSTTVLWVVPYLSYTPEQYTIYYGTTMDTLDLTSSVVSSTTDISATNTTYTISLKELTPNTVYFFQLHSVNTYGGTTTAVMTFTTSESGTNNFRTYLR